MVTSLVKSMISGGVSKSSTGVLVEGTRATFPEVDATAGTDVAVAESGTGTEVLADDVAMMGTGVVADAGAGTEASISELAEA
jgi:hypothetical protein